jgi:hypothetical protein
VDVLSVSRNGALATVALNNPSKHKQFVGRLTPRVAIPPAEWDEGYACFGTEDYRIGVEAFLQKQRPEFKGR